VERTNEMWLAELRDSSLQQADAIADLRRYLKWGVLAYLRTRSDLNNLAQSELKQMSEDFTQEALLKIQANLHTFQGKSKFITWAAKIAGNHAINELRRAKWRDLSIDAITEAGTPFQELLAGEPAKSSLPDIESEQHLVWQTITEVINHDLSERQRQALAAVHFENIPTPEVARLLDTNVNNLYKLLHDARLKLKRRLQALDLEPQYILSLFSENVPAARVSFCIGVDLS
jgi:RNA polymerase sigma-70 factor (ECF subfamily)